MRSSGSPEPSGRRRARGSARASSRGVGLPAGRGRLRLPDPPSSAVQRTFDKHDIDVLTGFANVVAEAVGTAERTATLKAALAEMQRLSEENGVLSAELQHRVRNNLQLVYGMLLRQVELSEPAVKEGIRAIARRVMTLSKIYDHLLGHGLVQTIDSAPISSLFVPV